MTEATNPRATMTLSGGGAIVLELDPVSAPLTVANFIKLAEQGFYNGLTFHRVIPGFMIQGGCPQGNGTGGPGYQIKGEFKANGISNPIRHERGVISMARASHPDSAGSQFFIMHQASTHLDGQYAAFGRVVSGMAEVDRIAACATNRQDRPLEEQRIDTVVLGK
jgi:peptidyl-prolyl cis-trans isomerase B (cyclophilin B)